MRRSRSVTRNLGLVLSLSLIGAASPFQPSSRSNHVRCGPPRPSSPQTRVRSAGKIRPPSPRQLPSGGSATSLDAIAPAAAISAIGSPLGSLTVLAFVILVHEAGHFLAARSLGIDVEEFSVGVGPRLVGVRRRRVEGGFVLESLDGDESAATVENDGAEYPADHGIEFSLRALPLGGYVRFPENYNRTLAFQVEDAARNARHEARLMRLEGASVLEKALEFMSANSFALNLLSFGLLKRWQTRREEVQLQQAEAEMKGARGLGQSNVNRRSSWWSALPPALKTDAAKEADDKLAILRATKAPEVDYFDNPNLLQNRPWLERAVVLSGGVIFNLLLAFAIYVGELSVGKGLPQPVFDAGAVVSLVSGKDSPSFGLLREGDVILGINDMITTSVRSSSDVWASQKGISDIISTIRETPEGQSVKLTIVHDGSGGGSDTVSVTPRRNDQGLVSIGVTLSPNYLRTDLVRASSVLDAFSKAGSAVYALTSKTASSILGLLLGFLLGSGPPAGAGLSGPIGVVKTGAELVSSSDLAAVFAFAASISINLAVVNSLPLPALDGGQLAFVLAEAVAGRRIDQRVQEGINTGALFILLVISVGTAVGDVTSIFR